MQFLRRARLFTVLIAALLVLLPLRLMTCAVTLDRPSRLGVLFFRMLLFGLRMRVTVHGEPMVRGLVVANHVSWTDIVVLGALRPAIFVAKAEVRGWPLLGWLARLHATIFVERDARRAADRQVAKVAAALEKVPVILFPEGTTGNGDDVLPFRSTLFAAVGDNGVQPVTVLYSPRGRDWRRGELGEFCWDGDKEFWPHLLHVSGDGPVDCEVLIHGVVRVTRDRKSLAATCRDIVRAPLQERGR